ncbi:MAG TPA: hypothetical protein ENK57_11570 [Polyangiaceae bacterium]|nr:hypothetical protein [Polyangiaceae bacterium]
MKAISLLLVGLGAFVAGIGLTLATSAGASPPCRPVDVIYLEMESHRIDGVDVERAPANPIRRVSALSNSDGVRVDQEDESQAYGVRSVLMRLETP